MKLPFEDWGKDRLDGLEVASSPGRTITLQGLGNIQWAIVIFMIGSVIGLALNIVRILLLKGRTEFMISMVFGIVFGLVSLVFLILAMVFLLRGIGELKKGDLSKDQAYARDLRTSLIASVIFLLLTTIVPFGIERLLGPITYLFRDNWALTLALTNTSFRILGAFTNAAFIVMLTYPIGRLTSRRSLDLLITFAVVNISVWVGTILLHTSVDLMSVLGLSATSSATMVLFYVIMVIDLIGPIPLLVAYRRTMASLKGKAQNHPREQRSFLPGSARLTATGTKTSIKPIRAISLIIIATILLIAGSTVLEYTSTASTFEHPYGDDGSNGQGGSFLTNTVKVTRDGELVQGESSEELFNVGLPLLSVEVGLQWTDEAADPTWTNGPDSFTLRVSLIEPNEGVTVYMDEKTSANPVEGTGEIILSFSLGSGSPEMIGSIQVLVTLVETGDQTGAFLGLRTRSDDSNGYSMSITYIYMED